MTCVIVGASSGLGRALAEIFAAAGYDLVLVSSDMRDLLALASDLTIRNGINVVPVDADLGGEDDYSRRIYEAAHELGDVRGLLFPIGANLGRDNVNIISSEADRLIRVNFSSLVSIIGTFMPIMLSRGSGFIVGFGSIAGSRGRNANVVYSAAKRALSSYFESLRHALVDSDVVVQFYVPGYLETNLAFGIPTKLPKASVKELGKRVLGNLDKDFGVTYYPSFWRGLCLALRLLPWFVFKRLKF